MSDTDSGGSISSDINSFVSYTPGKIQCDDCYVCFNEDKIPDSINECDMCHGTLCIECAKHLNIRYEICDECDKIHCLRLIKEFEYKCWANTRSVNKCNGCVDN